MRSYEERARIFCATDLVDPEKLAVQKQFGHESADEGCGRGVYACDGYKCAMAVQLMWNTANGSYYG